MHKFKSCWLVVLHRIRLDWTLCSISGQSKFIYSIQPSGSHDPIKSQKAQQDSVQYQIALDQNRTKTTPKESRGQWWIMGKSHWKVTRNKQTNWSKTGANDFWGQRCLRSFARIYITSPPVAGDKQWQLPRVEQRTAIAVSPTPAMKCGKLKSISRARSPPGQCLLSSGDILFNYNSITTGTVSHTLFVRPLSTTKWRCRPRPIQSNQSHIALSISFHSASIYMQFSCLCDTTPVYVVQVQIELNFCFLHEFGHFYWTWCTDTARMDAIKSVPIFLYNILL